MRYIISDIHGCYEEYLALLEKIDFKDEDTLYVLGDAVDRGPNPIKVLQDLMKRENVVYIIGNHDFVFRYFIGKMELEWKAFVFEEDKESFTGWLKNGGFSTMDGFLELPFEERKEIYEYLGEASAYETINYNDKKYVLVHAGIANFDESKSLDAYDGTDLITERMYYSKRYYQDESIFIITGHTPTPFIRRDSRPEIYEGNGHIAIDCGCVFGGRLAAYCIETGEVWYVDRIREEEL